LQALTLTIALFGCQNAPEISSCQPDGPEFYRYEDKASGERMTITREGQRLLFDFHIPEADYRPSKVEAEILEDDNHIRIANLLIPKDLSGEPVLSATAKCDVRLSGARENLYRVVCNYSHEKASEVVLLSIEKGIVEWSTLDEDGSKVSDYVLRSESGLFHTCVA